MRADESSRSVHDGEISAAAQRRARTPLPSGNAHRLAARQPANIANIREPLRLRLEQQLFRH